MRLVGQRHRPSKSGPWRKQARQAAEQERSAAQEARQAAEQSAQQAESVTKFLVDAFRSPDPERDGRTITVAEVLDRAVHEVHDKISDQPLVKARLLHALGESYGGLGLYREAEKLCQESLEIRQRVLGPTHPDTLESMNDLGVAYDRVGRTAEAVRLLEETLSYGARSLGSEHPDTLDSMNNLGVAYSEAGRTAEAIALLEETLRLRREKLGPEHPDTLESMNEPREHLL